MKRGARKEARRNAAPLLTCGRGGRSTQGFTTRSGRRPGSNIREKLVLRVARRAKRGEGIVELARPNGNDFERILELLLVLDELGRILLHLDDETDAAALGAGGRNLPIHSTSI